METKVVPIVSKTINLFPIHRNLIFVLAKFSRLKRPYFGFLDKAGKTYFIAGALKHFVGLRVVKSTC